MAEERLQKIISAAGIASRRRAEELIVTGHVSVNGVTITELGSKADVDVDDIRVDGHRLSAPKNLLYIALNKPTNVITTVHDPQGRETVMQFFKGMRERIYPVGRLDYASEGLILLTNDGEFAAKMMSPTSHVTKTYLVKANGILTTDQEEQFRRGIPMHGRRTAPAGLKLIKRNVNPWYEVRLVEGRQNQIRIMFKHFGRLVEKLKRVKIGFLELGTLKPGAYRTLTRSEVERFQKMLNAPNASASAALEQSDRAPQGRRSPDASQGGFRPPVRPTAKPAPSGEKKPFEKKAFEKKPFDPRKARPADRPPRSFAQEKPPERQQAFTAKPARVPRPFTPRDDRPRKESDEQRPRQQDGYSTRPPAAAPRSEGRKPFAPKQRGDRDERPARAYPQRGGRSANEPRDSQREPRGERRDQAPRPPKQEANFPPTRPPGARKWAGPPQSEERLRKPFVPREGGPRDSGSPRKAFKPAGPPAARKWAGPPKTGGPFQKKSGPAPKKWAGPNKPSGFAGKRPAAKVPGAKRSDPRKRD